MTEFRLKVALGRLSTMSVKYYLGTYRGCWLFVGDLGGFSADYKYLTLLPASTLLQFFRSIHQSQICGSSTQRRYVWQNLLAITFHRMPSFLTRGEMKRFRSKTCNSLMYMYKTRLGFQRSWSAASRQKGMALKGSGLILVVSTKRLVRSCQRPLIRCLSGTRKRKSAMPFWKMYTLLTSLSQETNLNKRDGLVFSNSIFLAWVVLDSNCSQY